MENFKTNDYIEIKLINRSDDNTWAMPQRYELEMNHRDEKGRNIDGKYIVIYKKEKVLKQIIKFLNIKYNELH